MSENSDIKVVTLSLGSFNGATELPLVKFPPGIGGYTVLEANLSGAEGTIIGVKLLTMTDAGTEIRRPPCKVSALIKGRHGFEDIVAVSLRYERKT